MAASAGADNSRLGDGVQARGRHPVPCDVRNVGRGRDRRTDTRFDLRARRSHCRYVPAIFIRQVRGRSWGTTASVSRPDQIVAGRFNGLRRAVNTLGFGGRRARKDGTITAGAILLDRDFDSASTSRRLLRTHELGHALGYNHVHARASIMNPHIGTEPNEFDREAALFAFRAPAIVAVR